MRRAWWLVVLACLLVTTPVSGASDERVVERLAGATRIETATAVATRAFPEGAPRAYLARADVFADAVAAGSLRDGPVLLVHSCGEVPRAVRGTIERLDPDEVIALGGESAVCEDTLRRAAGPERSTDRLAGASRIETAVAIARRSFEDRAERVYLARADELADAVAAGSLTDGPVLLVPRCGEVPPPVRDEIARLRPSSVVALGGPAAICNDLLATAAIGASPARLAGPARATTAVAISEHHFPAGATTVHLARADGLSDAVAAGSLRGGPILLVPTCGVVPEQVTREIGRLDPDEVVVLGGEDAICSGVTEQLRDTTFCRSTTFTNRGPATTGVAVTAAAMLPSGPWVVTRHRSPAVAAGLDPRTGEVSRIVEIPSDAGAWAATVASGGLYIGATAAPELYRVDPTTGAIRLLARIAGERQFWDLTAAPDGRVFGGTFPGGKVVEYDPLTGSTTTGTQVVAGQEYIRSIAASRRHVYAGVGPEAHLVQIDRVTGEQVRLAEDQLRGEAFVYDVAVSGTTVVAGTWPSGLLVTVDTTRPEGVTVVRAESGARAAISTVTVVDDHVYFTTRTGRLWRYELENGDLTPLAVPVPDEETRALFVERDVVTGVGGSGKVWTYDLSDGNTVVRDLVDLGLTAGPEPVQSVAMRGSVVYVGGHWQLDVFDLATGERARHRAPGEPKAVAADDDGVFAALYPDGELWRLETTGTPERLALRVGDAQIRPRDLEITRGTGRVVIATQSDYGRLGGAIAIVDGRDGSDTAPVVLTDLVPWQAVRSVASDARSLYLGSEIWGGVGAEPLAREAVVGSYGQLRLTPDWDLVPVPGATAIVGLEIIDDHPVGVTERGTVFTIDPSVPEVIWRHELDTDVRGVAAGDGYLHVATSAGVLRVNPWTSVTATVLDGDATAIAARPRGCGLVGVIDRDLIVGRV